MGVSNAAHDCPQQPRSPLEISTELAWSQSSTQKLVQQIAVARLDVDELKTCLLRQASGSDIVVNQPL